MATRRPTLRAQWLGKMLKELREQNGLKLTDTGEYLQRSFSAISKFESGALPIREPEVRALMDLYGVEGESQRTALIQLAQEISRTGWWEKYSGDVTAWFADYVWLESRAELIQTFDVAPINGLLQTAGYAEALMRAVNPTDSAAQIERGVELRKSRQEILDGADPARLEVVTDEAALRRVVGGPHVMKQQLNHLLKYMERGNVDVRVIPFAAGAIPSPDGGFRLIKMEDPFPLVAYTIGSAGGLYLEAKEAEKLAALYDRLRVKSLPSRESADLIASIERDLE